MLIEIEMNGHHGRVHKVQIGEGELSCDHIHEHFKRFESTCTKKASHFVLVAVLASFL